MLIGDMDARIGKGEKVINKEEFTSIVDNIRKNQFNTKSKRYLEFYGSFGLRIVNGTNSADCNGEFTFICTERVSVIDYCLIRSEWNSYVTDMEVKRVTYSDHLPTTCIFGLKALISDTREMNILPKLICNKSGASLYTRPFEEKLTFHPELSLNDNEQQIKINKLRYKPA